MLIFSSTDKDIAIFQSLSASPPPSISLLFIRALCGWLSCYLITVIYAQSASMMEKNAWKFHHLPVVITQYNHSFCPPHQPHPHCYIFARTVVDCWINFSLRDLRIIDSDGMNLSTMLLLVMVIFSCINECDGRNDTIGDRGDGRAPCMIHFVGDDDCWWMRCSGTKCHGWCGVIFFGRQWVVSVARASVEWGKTFFMT